MDKNVHDIEDLFRKTLEQNEENPPQRAWDRIEKKLDKDKVVSIKKKYDSLKKVALLLLFLLAGLSIYVWKSQNRNTAKPDKDISEINKDVKLKNERLKEESETTTLQKSIDSLAINKTSNPGQIAKESHRINDRTTFKNENARQTKPVNSLILKRLPNTSINQNKLEVKKTVESDLSEVSKFSSQKKDELIKRKSNEIVETTIPNRIESRHPAFISPGGIQNVYSLPAIATSNLKDVREVKSNTGDLLATKETFHNIASGKIDPLIQIEKTKVRKPSVKSTKQPHFAITGFYSPDIAFYHFEDNDPGNSNNTNFENSETESYSSTLGALVDYTISNHWGLQSGITLATSNFNLESETLYAQQDNLGGIKYKLSTPLGDAYVLPSFSSNPSIGDSIFSKSPTHTLQYLGIPLAVRYNFNQGKFSLNALGGITANFLTRGRISTELKSGADNEIETTDKIHGLKTFYLSGLAGVGLDYNIYKKFSLTFSPTFRFALNSINNDGSVLSYPNSFGFAFGIKMKL
ncbi:MAG TPA: outer membrane beta-barrel protein [Hanamia sp.]